MCSEHNTPVPVPQKTPASGMRARANKAYARYLERPSIDTHSSNQEVEEKAIPRQVRSPMLDLSHYKVVNQVWHYCSVDWGSKYLCIGYNSLSDTKITPDNKAEGEQNTSQTGNDDDDDDLARSRSDNNPEGARTWTWLVLCDDGTIISIYENPFPGHQGALDDQEKERLERIRRNLLNVFMQLSQVNDAHRRENPIYTLDIRPGLESNQTSNINISDSPGLLFYYLFDDWYTSYALVSKEEHQYAKLLEKLRQDMFEKPHLELIQRLHQYGRQLSVLRRMYQSYALIIQRVLDRQKPVNDSNATTPRPNDESPLPAGERPAEVAKFGAPLSAAATVRFERLQDRITHFAISEIQECLDEKEALVFLVRPSPSPSPSPIPLPPLTPPPPQNFNLITLKQSVAVERLTRITILLAKVTILFMPASLMTGYFSTQLKDLATAYTIKTYWICFAVIMALSFIFLLVFGALSGTLEGKPIYRSLTQTMVDAAKGRWRTRRDRGRKGK